MLFRGEGMQNRHTLKLAGSVAKFPWVGLGSRGVYCQTIPFRRGQERAPHCDASQGRRVRYRTTARLYARRRAGSMHVAGKDGEDRLVRIDARLENGKVRTIADAPRQERCN